jgi:hypothetical protein
MAKNITLNQIKAILESGNFGELITAIEDEQLECKVVPYQLSQDHQKQELAKDVSAFANANGGVILIGVRTERNPTHFGDEISEICSFSQEIVNPGQYQDILQSWIYPAPQQVEIRWFPSVVNQEKGIATIIIPNQTAARRPFLVKRTIEDTGKRVEVIFGYVERRQANAHPLRVEEIHALIRDGLRYDQLQQQYESIQESLQELLAVQRREEGLISQRNIDELLNDRVVEGLMAVDLLQSPAFILAAIPTQPVEIPTLFARRNAEIVRLLEQPPELRPSGFDLNTGAPARIIRGQLRRAVNTGYKILDLWRDGTLIFVATGGAEFLCWGKQTRAGGRLRINPLVLIESTYLFAELARKVFEHAQPHPEEIKYRLQLQNMTVNSEPCVLIPGPLGAFQWEFGTNIHTAPDSSVTITGQDSDPHPGAVAFKLVAELYTWFGLEHDQIPYTEGLNDQLVISPDQIRRAGRSPTV